MNEIFKQLRIISEGKELSFEEILAVFEESIKLAFMDKGRRSTKDEMFPIFMQRIQVNISETKNDITITFYKAVVEKVKNQWVEIDINDPLLPDNKRTPGELYKKTVKMKSLPRSIADNIKKIFKNRLNSKEKEQYYRYYEENKIKKLVDGIVIGRAKENRVAIGYKVDLDKVYGFIPNDETVFIDKYIMGKKMVFYVKEIKEEDAEKKIILSRKDIGIIRELLKRQIPEVENGHVAIKSIVRDPGIRTKISVYSDNMKLDPVGACLGPGASRIAEIKKVIGGEKVDVIHFTENIEEYIRNSLKPTIIERINLNKRRKKALVVIPDENKQLAHALGKNSSNKNLTAELIGWEIDIKRKSEYRETLERERNIQLKSRTVLMSIKGLSEELATLLTEKFGSLTEIAGLTPDELMSFEEIDEKLAKKIIQMSDKNKGV